MELTDTLMSELRVPHADKEMILVIGVGGAGCNAVANMFRAGIHGVAYLACNTDQKSLNINPVSCKVRLGEEGLGAGNRPEQGRAAAIASLDELRFRITASGCRMVFIAAGMGGGTGTGAAPVIARLARELGLLTVGIVTSPLASEGRKRWRQAMDAIAEMEQNVDALLVIDNENVVRTYDDLPLREAFSRADNVLATATRGIAEIVTRESDLVGVDFADVSEVMRNCGRAHMSVTSARGENRVEEVIDASLHSPLLGRTRIVGAQNILLNFSVADSDQLKTGEVKQVLERIQQHACNGRSTDGLSETNIIWGTSVNPDMEPGVLELVVIATGFEVGQPQPAPIPPLPDTSEMPLPPETPETPSAATAPASATEPDCGTESEVEAEIRLEGDSFDLESASESGRTGSEAPENRVPRFWEQLSRRITLSIEHIFEGGEDTPM